MLFILVIAVRVNFQDRIFLYISLIVPLVIIELLKRKDPKLFIVVFAMSVVLFSTIYSQEAQYQVSNNEILAGRQFNYTEYEAPFLFHPYNHFRDIDGCFFYSNNSEYWYKGSRQIYYKFHLTALEKLNLSYSSGIVKVYCK